MASHTLKSSAMSRLGTLTLLNTPFLCVRYKWDELNDPVNAKVTLSMDDKAIEIIKSYEKVTGNTPRIQRTPGKPGEILE